MNINVKELFDAAAASYDSERRGLIPCFDDFYGAAIRYLNLTTDKPHIVDLGAGTGLLTAFVLHLYPEANITLVDFSNEMLAKAKERLAAYPSVRYITEDYLKFQPEQQCDAIVSSLSIHHLNDPEKKQLFRLIYSHLKQGGLFINADQASSRSELFNQIYVKQWEQAVLNSGLPSSSLEASKKRRKEDCNAPMEDQLIWLRKAGFEHADCVYRYNEFTVFVAKK